MSTPISHAEDSAHAGPIKNPRQFVFTVLASFVLPIFIIIGLVLFVTYRFKPSGVNSGEKTMELSGVTEQSAEQSMMARLQKIGMVEIRDANRPLKAGEEVFKAQCSACHAAGVAGAPKFGDAAAWAPRIPHGYEALLTSALKGKGAMGPQGGGDFEDVEIGRGVVYMVNAAGGNLPVPQKAGAAAAEAPAAAGAPAVQAAVPATPVSAVLAAAAPANPAPMVAASSPAAVANVAATTAATAIANAAPATGNAPSKDTTSPTTALAATVPTAATPPATPTSAAAPAAAAAVAAVAPVPAATPVNAAAGAALYKSVCFACHAAGVAGAPKFGDKAAWAPHIAKGMPTLMMSVKNGIGAMPPRGGSSASDADLMAAVEYMVSAAK